ncbi:MAG TPA: carboxypeptidase-like regulatory domain-containing protein, partial [Thermoanaerobaculia bacterium]|nr:carboxypeptidase-like regulatory domain-containing protein [Thermoanaerobaculia bacterium]
VTVEDFPFPPLPEVRGRVLDPEGLPVRHVNVFFLQGERRVYAGTDFQGRFKVHLVDGTWTVNAEMQGLGPAATTITMADAPVEIPDLRLLPTATVSGYLRGLAPGEIPFVQAKSEDGLWTRESRAGQDLRFHIPDLWPGTWILTAFVDERQASTRVRILPGDKAARADLSFGED